jgi:hypothetical protein
MSKIYARFLTLVWLCIIDLSVIGNKVSVECSEFPRLLYFVPANPGNAYTINEKNQFTNRISNGWMFEADKRIKLIVYLLVEGINCSF